MTGSDTDADDRVREPVTARDGQPAFTVFIPTYNRAHTLPAVFESLMAQTFRDFEVIVVDDGSTDGTRDLIDSWRSKFFFPMKYVYQENRGKPSAHNRALQDAEGVLFMTLDSDDSLLPDALENIYNHWNRIPERDRDSFAGISGLCLDEKGSLSGTPYPEDVLDVTYLELMGQHEMRGEKREAMRTDILREYPYPIIEGERHIRPTMIFRRISLHYRTRFVNIPIQINRHAPDGITSNRFRYRMANPKGLRLCFLEDITDFSRYLSLKKLFRSHTRYVRYSLHSGVGVLRQAREIKHPVLWVLALPEGVLKWYRDRCLKGSRR